MWRRIQKLAWYWKRARVMSGPELVYRLWHQLDLLVLRLSWRFKLGLCRPKRYPAAEFRFCSARTQQLPTLSWDFNPSAAEVEALLDGQWPALGFSWRWRDDPDVWREAPENGRLWPRNFFGSIGYRPGNPNGDARVVWEPSRLQQLVTLALLARSGTGPQAEKAISLIRAEFLSWVTANPPLAGVHYVSAMECALRLIAVCHALDFVRDKLESDDPVWAVLPGFVNSHARLIARRLSLYSSRGNHTIAECTGLIYACLLFPELKMPTRWQRLSVALITAETNRLTLHDGGGLEQAPWYHVFVLDLCGLVTRLLQHDSHSVVPEPLKEAVSRGRAFVNALASEPERLPDLGDRDDGFALSRYLRITWERETRSSDMQLFRQTGLTKIVLSRNNRADLFFDHGPLGMAPGYGHGHADALSIILGVDGAAILVDPGTYGYGLDPDWRAYFRGTAAHNTVVVDGRDQARQETAFQWREPYSVTPPQVTRLEDGSVLIRAGHDGYRALGVSHRRSILVVPEAGFCVWDDIDGAGDPDVCAHWHVAGDPQVSDRETRLRLGNGSLSITLEAHGGVVEYRKGRPGSQEGWAAPRYGRLEPITTVAIRAGTGLPCRLETRIRLDGVFGPLPGESRGKEKIAEWDADG